MSRFEVVLLFLLLSVTSTHAAERYEAMFADGSRVETNELADWDTPVAQPKIHDPLLPDSGNPVRWIKDRDQPVPVRPQAYVEFEGGDRLPGEVISFSNGVDNPYEICPRYFVVKPSIDLQPPDVFGSIDMRVTAEWVRRIVWEQIAEDVYQPGTIWLRSRKSMTYRSLRWTPEGVAALTTEGLKNIAMSDLAEVHLPRQDAWAAYFNQVAVLSPDLKTRLIQMDCVDGGRLTTSFERHQARHFGDRNRQEQRYQLIQPAWSLDSIWLRFRSIRHWRFFSPNEVPLTIFSPVNATHSPVFGRAFDWKVNVNVQNGPLRSQHAEFGWGFGVHGSSQLDFSIPKIARSVRSKYGLDRTVESGGCVNLELVANRQTIAKQIHLIGSQTVNDTGWLDIPASKEEGQISLRTDMAHEYRPPASDPYDIRDLLNWYEPEVRLDRSLLADEITSRGATRLSGFVGWSISPEDARSIRLKNSIDTSDPRDPQFRLVARSANATYSLTRKVQVRDRDRWMAIVASRNEEDSSPSSIEVRIDDRSMGHFEIPLRQSMTDPDPILVPIHEFQGRTISAEVLVKSTDDKSWIDWRGFAVRAERPGLLTIFEDGKSFVDKLNSKEGKVERDSINRYAGTSSLKVTSLSVSNPLLPGLNATICEHPRLGQYRYLVFAWKKPTGKRIQLRLANRGRLGTDISIDESSQAITPGPFPLRRTQQWDQRGRRFRYSYEQGVASTDPPAPLWMRGDLPSDWQLVQRDLFNDFGTFLLTGLSLHCPDGDAAWFDHLYLARTKEDAESLIQNENE